MLYHALFNNRGPSSSSRSGSSQIFFNLSFPSLFFTLPSLQGKVTSEVDYKGILTGSMCHCCSLGMFSSPQLLFSIFLSLISFCRYFSSEIEFLYWHISNNCSKTDSSAYIQCLFMTDWSKQPQHLYFVPFICSSNWFSW